MPELLNWFAKHQYRVVVDRETASYAPGLEVLSREEMASAEDRGTYFRVPLDTRSLNYGLYFEEGDQRKAEVDDYTSHNAQRLGVDAVSELLSSLPEIAHSERSAN